jgi:8-oxo-dGTP pyrophosphatase MutT (NUDIX family)
MDLPPLLASLAVVLARRGAPGKPEPGRRAAAVLVPFFYRGSELRLVLFRRTDRVPTHQGQVAFPGGSADPGDKTLLDAALREAHEELAIDPARVLPLGPLRPFNTRGSDFALYPFVGFLQDRDPTFVPQPFEVDEIIEVPVTQLRNPRSRKRGLVPGFARMVPIPLPYYNINGGIIWGVSGAVVDDLLSALEEADAAAS